MTITANACEKRQWYSGKSAIEGDKILSRSYSDWKKMGFSKGTLHYMKKNSHVKERLEMGKDVD